MGFFIIPTVCDKLYTAVTGGSSDCSQYVWENSEGAEAVVVQAAQAMLL
jgi:hypothetical protein